MSLALHTSYVRLAQTGTRYTSPNTVRRSPRQSSRRGFTLIEMIVALGIFSIVAVVALGALTKIIAANKKAQTLQAAVNNITYALESISREMRTGRYYFCSTPILLPEGTFSGNDLESSCSEPTVADSSDNVVVAFQSTRSADDGLGGRCNLITAYWFGERSDNSSTELSVEKAEQEECGVPLVTDDFSPILDRQVFVSDFHLKAVDAAHPMMFIQIAGYVGATDRERTTFNVQTAVSARSQ